MAKTNEEKVVAAAKKVFVRYGFRRVTMGDLAEAAKMSRPALYLVFPSKEEIFIAVLKRFFAEVLEEIRQGIPLHATPLEKLAFAFEVWCVRPFEMVRASPDAGDLFESSLEFAKEFTDAATVEFEVIISDVLEPLIRGNPQPEFSAAQVARIMTSAEHGFKSSAKDATQLRLLIDQLCRLALSGVKFTD